MAKHRVKNLFAIALTALMLLPLSINSLGAAKADAVDKEIKVVSGVEFTYEIDGALKSAAINTVTIKDGSGDNAKTIYTNGKDDNDNDNFVVTYTAGSSSNNAKVKAKIFGANDYLFVVTDGTNTHTTKISVKANADGFSMPAYKEVNDANKSVYDKFKQNVETNTLNSDKSANIRIGDTFTLPEIKDLLELPELMDFDKYKRTLYYATPGSSTYATSTATGTSSLKFNITALGEYRFYVTLDSDEIDGKAFELNTNNTVEKIDGFYKYYLNDKEVYVDGEGENVKYYEDEKLEKEIENANTLTSKLVVPVFTFDIVNNAGPSVKINSNYQEKGYIDLDYKLSSITINGNDVTTTYTLEYKATESGAYEVAEEEFDSTNKKFTPTKQGYYRVRILVEDGDGLTDEAVTKDIVVTERFVSVEYKTGFGEWLEVNVVPFIFLCISAACLIAIVLLLVIKPKKAADLEVEGDEEDR